MIFLHAPSVFIPKRLWFLGASTDERISTLTALSIPRSTGERYHADVWGNRLSFPPKTKNNFSGIDISYPTPSMSLSVPSFSLDIVFLRVQKS